MRTIALLVTAVFLIGCRDQDGPSAEEIAAYRKKTADQMEAFDAMLEENGIENPFPGEPAMESFGNAYDLSFLVGKRVDDFPRFFEVADGPLGERPRGICFRKWADDKTVTYFTCETNASKMTADMAPSDRLALAVRDDEIIGYCFDPYYLH